MYQDDEAPRSVSPAVLAISQLGDWADIVPSRRWRYQLSVLADVLVSHCRRGRR